MFGWKIIRDEEYQILKRSYFVSQKVINCRRWFSGWKDLDIIWEYLLSETYFGSIDSCRDKYAKARKTDVYGKVCE